MKISHEEGIPIMRALYLHHPNDSNTFDIDDEYYLGNELLIAPFTSMGNKREVYLPKSNWIDFWTQKEYKGQQNLTYSTELNRIPVFVKESAIIPLELNNELKIGGMFPQKNKNDLLLSFRVFKGGNTNYIFDDNENQVRIVKNISGEMLKIEVSNIKKKFGLLIDGLFPVSITVNGSRIEKLDKQVFSKAIQGWRYDSIQNQTLMKIEAIPDIVNYSIEIKKPRQNKAASTLSPPLIKQVIGWDQSIDVSFQPVESSDSYVIKYWNESDTVEDELKVTNSPATISGLINNEKYNFVIYSVRGDSLSASSSIESAIPQKRKAFFCTNKSQIFINANHYLFKEKLHEGGHKYIYGFLCEQESNHVFWVKACKNVNHHQYFRWYKLGSITLKKGYNYIALDILKDKTEIERIYLTSTDNQRPVLQDESESAFTEKNSFRIKNEITIDF